MQPSPIDDQRYSAVVDDPKITRVYDRNRLKTESSSAGTVTYSYDPLGRLTTVNVPGTAQDMTYTYDGYDRLVTEKVGPTTTVTTFDALDRPAVKKVTPGTSPVETTRYNYLGLTEQVAVEEELDAGVFEVAKTFTYGPDGKPLALVQSDPAKTRYYSANPHGDTEVLTDPYDPNNPTTTGLAKATYRYTAYGTAEDIGTTGEDANPTGESDQDILNPYRFNSKRINPASGGYDMGFRNYDPGIASFLTRDMYNGAMDDLALGVDPWTSNRYAFAGGNPVTGVELDGHKPTGPTEHDDPTYQYNDPKSYFADAPVQQPQSGQIAQDVTAPRAVDVGGPAEASYTSQAFDSIAAHQQLCGGVGTLGTSEWGAPAFGCAGGSPDLGAVRADLVEEDADAWLASLQQAAYERRLAAARERANGTIPWLYGLYGFWVDSGTVNAQAGIGVGHGGYSHARNPRTGDSDIYLGAGAHTPSLTKSRFGASVTWAPAKPDPNANASGGIVVCAPACIGWQTGMTDGLSFGGGSFVFGWGGGVTDGGAFIDVQHQIR